MSLVQFWIVVDGLRDPLEDFLIDDDGAGDAAAPAWTDSDRVDIAQINEAYLSKPELKVPPESRAAVKTFLQAGRKATSAQYKKARGAIFSAQSSVLDEMENRHYPGFKSSDLYYKYLTSDEGTARKPIPAIEPAMRRPQALRISTDTKAKPHLAARSSSQPNIKTLNLQRSAKSSADMRSMVKRSEDSSPQRRSFDVDTSKPLFDDDYDTDPLANSVQSLGKASDEGGKHGKVDSEVVDAMEQALNGIMTDEPDQNIDKSSIFDSPVSSLKSVKDNDLFGSPRGSLEFSRPEPFHAERNKSDQTTVDKLKPSIASLGLVNSSGRIGVFTDDDLFAEEEKKFIEDEHADPDDDDDDKIDGEIHEAAPGDLGLAEAIAVLNADIERLVTQEKVVDALTKKAELTNNVAELRILGKSKASLQREIRRKEMQRQQYIIQESDNSLYGRATVSIKSIVVGKEDDGREYALYMIDVQRKAGDQMPAATWAVARRYSEFHDLHQRLRARYPSVRNLDFPRRRVVMKLQKEFLHRRRVALEQYLSQLLLLPNVCRSLELRAFLSQQAIIPSTDLSRESDTKDIVTRIYNSVTDGMDDFLGNITVLDQLSVAGQNLISAATSQLNNPNPNLMPPQQGILAPSSPTPSTLAGAEAEAELSAYDSQRADPATHRPTLRHAHCLPLPRALRAQPLHKLAARPRCRRRLAPAPRRHNRAQVQRPVPRLHDPGLHLQLHQHHPRDDVARRENEGEGRKEQGAEGAQ